MEEQYSFKKPLWGFVAFAVLLVSLIFVGGIVQYFWGMWGLALTELMFALLAVLFVKLYHFDIKEVFPVKIPRWRTLFGVALMWIGTYLLVLISTTVLMYFFPQGMNAVSSDISQVLYSVSLPLVVIIACVMPAICEEMINRGVILYTMGKLGEWRQVLIVGVLFGVFHLSFYRFIPTALLGIALAYIMVKTKNILMPMLFHLINNLFATVPSMLISETADSASVMTPSTIGSVMILGAFAPIIIYAAANLLREKSEGCVKRKKTAVVAAVLFGAVLLAGGVFLVKSTMHEPFTFSQTYTLSSGESIEIPAIAVEESDTYTVYMKLSSNHGLIVVSLEDENTGEIFVFSAASYSGTGTYTLQQGTYHFKITALTTQQGVTDYYDAEGIDYDAPALSDLDFSENGAADISVELMLY